MGGKESPAYTAFEGDRLLASGALVDVVTRTKLAIDRQGTSPVLIFLDATGEVVDVDYRGTIRDVIARLEEGQAQGGEDCDPTTTPPSARRRPGRPRLGVVSKEVTLLPEQWAWLKSQPGGASAALRRLVHDATKRNRARDAIRHSQEATFRFMSAMAGDRPAYEEAARSLFAGERERFESLTDSWPVDVRYHVRRLAGPAFGVAKTEQASRG